MLTNRLRRWATIYRFYLDYKAFLKNPCRTTDMRQQTYLRQAFVNSRGAATEWAYRQHVKLAPHSPAETQSAFFTATESDIQHAVVSLQRDGVAIWPYRMPETWIAAVSHYLENLDVIARCDQTDVQHPSTLRPKHATYWHNPADLYENPDLVNFFLEPVLREVIERYLRCKTVFDFGTSWWSYPSSQPESAGAQLYHFDCDRVRWVKVFCYLTDVSSENGPHTIVKKTHTTSAHLASRDGRFSDDEIASLNLDTEIQTLTGPAGTIFLEDTRAFHKGTPVKEGTRCVVEYERSVSHYGLPYPPLDERFN